MAAQWLRGIFSRPAENQAERPGAMLARHGFVLLSGSAAVYAKMVPPRGSDPMDVDLSPKEEVKEICRGIVNDAVRKAILRVQIQEEYDRNIIMPWLQQAQASDGSADRNIIMPWLQQAQASDGSAASSGGGGSAGQSAPAPGGAGPGNSPAPGGVGPGNSPAPGGVGPGNGPAPGGVGPGNGPAPGGAAPGGGPAPMEVTYGPNGAPHPLGTTSLADLVGITAFRNERQVREAAACGVAAYRAFDHIDGNNVDVEVKVSVAESLKQQANKLFGKPKKHSARHRCANRFYRRVAVVKALVDQVKFAAPCIFTGSDADKRALFLIVRRVVKEARDDGVPLPNGKVHITDREKAWYLKAVCTSYYIQEEDDVFWERLAESGSAITA